MPWMMMFYDGLRLINSILIYANDKEAAELKAKTHLHMLYSAHKNITVVVIPKSMDRKDG